MKKLLLSIFLLFTFAFPAMVHAQDAGVSDDVVSLSDSTAAVDVSPDAPEDVFVALFDKVQGGEWLPAFGAVLILLVFASRKLLSIRFKWFKTKLGGSALAFGISLVMAVATALLAGQAVTVGLVATALGVAWAAGGGWENFKDILSYFGEAKA